MDALLERQAKVQDQLDTMHAVWIAAWVGHGRIALSTRRHSGRRASGERRRVALFVAAQEPDILLSTAHQPPGCRIGRMAGEPSATVLGTVIAVTHDHYFRQRRRRILELGADTVCRGRQHSSWLEQKQAARAEARTETVRQRILRELEWLHMSPDNRPSQRVSTRNELVAQTRGARQRRTRNFCAPVHAWVTW